MVTMLTAAISPASFAPKSTSFSLSYGNTDTPAIAGVRSCQHCRAAVVCRPRGLCWSCYYKPGIRDCYPSQSKYARRGIPDSQECFNLPAEPTAAQPGTANKVAVMVARAARQEALFHPLDAPSPCTSAAVTVIDAWDLVVRRLALARS
jgi:hypothetical protein